LEETLSHLLAPQSLGDLLNYKLARLQALSGVAVIRICEGRFSITRREWRFVALLAERGALSPSQLAEESHLELSRVSRIVTTLVDKRLADRTLVSGDRRRALVTLTDKGQNLYADLFPLVADINVALLSCLQPEQAAALDETLDRLTAQAEQLMLASKVPYKADRQRRAARPPRSG
jgi:DNA-binding MarR family transcriptional regulator